MLAQRHAERPPQGDGVFTMPLKYYADETRGAETLLQFSAAYEPERGSAHGGGATPRRRDLGSCGLVEGVVAPPLAVPAASSSAGPKAAADAAQPAAPDPMVEEHEAGVPLWAGPSDAWADFAVDRVQLQEIVAWIRDTDGASPGCDRSSFHQAWSKAKARCSRATGAKPRDRLLPAGVRPLVAFIDIASSEWPLYAEKRLKRKGKVHDGWDERFLDGEWDVTALTSEKMHDLNSSSPCLSGGRALASLAAVQFRAAQQLPQEKNRSQLRREGRRRAQREHRVLGRPKLSGKHRPRLPDSLRKLYGAGEETQKRLFGFMDCGGKRDVTQF